MKRILIHYTHKETLGHTTRIAALVNAIARPHAGKAEILVLQGGVPQPYVAHPAGCRMLDIPHPFDSRDSFREYGVTRRSVERASFIVNAAQEFKPDIFITEFFPFGRPSYIPELLPVLRHLRQNGTRIMASIGYPYLIPLLDLRDRNFAKVFASLLDLYDRFLIHTPKDLETPYFLNSIVDPDARAIYKKTLQRIIDRVTFTGYIVPDTILKPASTLFKNTLPSAKNTVIVSRGGGAVYPKLIVDAIRAQALLGKDFRTIIACGPSTSAKEKDLFRACLKKDKTRRVLLTEYLPDLDAHLASCDVSVSLAGYNTSVQLMRHGTPAVLIPYQNLHAQMPTNDQIARTRLFEEKFESIRVDYSSLTPGALANAVEKRAAMPRPKPGPAAWFTGAATSARIIVAGK